MPRRHISPRKARAELLALKLEKARYEIRALRRIERDREAARALRRATPDWVEMKEQLIRLELEVELDAMEACIGERRPKIPILDKALMAKLRAAYSAETPVAVATRSPARKAAPHPDVKTAADWRAAEAAHAAETPHTANQNHPPPPGGTAWKYESTLPDRRPEDDWRNWE